MDQCTVKNDGRVHFRSVDVGQKRPASENIPPAEASKRSRLNSQSKESFLKEFADTMPILSRPLKPHFAISDNAVETFLRFWIPQVSVPDAVVRYGMTGELGKYLPIFTLLSAVAIVGTSKIDPVVIKGRGSEDDAVELAIDDDTEITLTAPDHSRQRVQASHREKDRKHAIHDLR